MKVRIQETIEFHKSDVPAIKRMAKNYGHDSWRSFVSWFVTAEGSEGLRSEISSNREFYERSEREGKGDSI